MLMQLKRMSLVVATAAIVAGCHTTNPYTGEKEVNKTTAYGGIGAVTGAVIGGLVGGGEGALEGAAIGAVAGAGYGYYTDRQEAALRKELQGTGVQVHRDGDNLKLIMPSNITFDTNKSAIKSSFYPVLGSVAKVVKEFDKNLVDIVGYTDSTGSNKINLPLSEDRARSVADYLIYQGVAGSRITYSGAGASDPIGNNSTMQGRALNRRVEINLIPDPKHQ
ncbi:OmpA family protein [Endozoicomonas sp. 8E]|uniref:OmpA family protein n=1 Tax=Endozoicomonas sp. 8E TaxID=3035692 RepID=UPI0029391E69|nr:OmpA family protein [Endozoicomonas sp. 8E]